MADRQCLDEIANLTDEELAAEIKSAGLPLLPITPTTRKVFERKLARLRGQTVSRNEEHLQISDKDGNQTEGTEQQLNGKASAGNGLCVDKPISPYAVNESPKLFYGVWYPPDNNVNENRDSLSVFTNKCDALQAVKKVKGSRFNVYKTFSEAEKFSRSSYGSNEQHPLRSSVLSNSSEPGSNFRAPKTPELSKFRRIIEGGKIEDFLNIVNSNPRYLVSSGDTPVIVQEGCRYNAMHVAAKSNHAKICQLIIETLESDEFWQHFLQLKEQSPTSFKRKTFLVDMYLNTPDKPDRGNSETPLHFACKFGNVDVVEYLVSHPLTKKNCVNKYGETPEQVVCTRCSGNVPTLKKKILGLLEDSVYVPVFGHEDNCTSPRIGEPWSPDMILDVHKSSLLYNSTGNPPNHQVMVRAYAGPMSPSKAKEFHQQWKSPPPVQGHKTKYSRILRSDCDRGLERIGRELAHDQGIPWTEYWSFLGCYADLQTNCGLKKLEQYLIKRKEIFVNAFGPENKTPECIDKSNFKTPPKGQSTIVFSPEQVDSDSDDVGFSVQRSDNPESPTLQIMHQNEHQSPELCSGSHKNICNSELGYMEYVSGDSKFYDINEISNNFESLSLRDGSKIRLEEPSYGSSIQSSPTAETSYGRKSNFPFKKKLIEDYEKEEVFNNVIGFGTDEEVNKCLFSDAYDETDLKRDKDEVIPGIGNNSNSTKPNNAKLIVREEAVEDLEDTSHKTNKERVKNNNNKLFPAATNNVKELNPTIASLTNSNFQGEDYKRTGVDDVVDSIDNKAAHCRQTTCVSSSESQLVCTQTLNDHRNLSTHSEEEMALLNLKGINEPSELDVKRCASVSSVAEFRVKSKKDNQVKVFIQGPFPSKLDLDVYRALSGVTVDPILYPNVTQWKQMVMGYSEATQESWPSPGSPRFRLRKTESRLIWSC